jgi:hypothetical protein
MLESKSLIFWGRLTLINSVLSSLPMFVMYIFEILRGGFEKNRPM